MINLKANFRKMSVGVALFGASLCFNASANATVVDESDLAGCDWMASCAVDGAQLSGVGGLLDGKTVAGQFGLGISGRTGGEIDPGESLLVEFDKDVLVEAFRLVFLFNGPEFGDPNEQGNLKVTLADDTIVNFAINAVGEDMATIDSGFGTVTNCGGTQRGDSGCFDFTDMPLGDQAIASIAFNAVSVVDMGNDSDFALASFDVSEVPLPLSGWLMMSGIGGLAAARRKRRNA